MSHSKLFRSFLILLMISLMIKHPLPVHSNSPNQGSITIPISGLNVREGAGLHYPIIGQVHLGETFSVLSVQENWLKIQLNDGELGWVASWLVEFQQPTPSSSAFITAKIDGLNVRSGPSTSFQAIETINRGEPYLQLDTEGDWIKIKLKNGQSGWTANWLVEETSTPKPASTPSLDQAIVNIPLLNVRSGPDTSYSLVGQVSEGETLHILQRKGDWMEVKGKEITGWVATWLVSQPSAPPDRSTKASVKILNPGTNIRSGPETTSNVIYIASLEETFPVIAKEGDWFKIQLPNQEVGYVAGWIVSAQGIANVERKGIETLLKGRTIMIDPGHGGNDSGAIGPHLGSLEKEVNLKVSRLLSSKLKAAGATIYMTRGNDRKVSLEDRVWMAIDKQVDAFISVHHNTSENYRVNGVITYFYSNGEDRTLAGLLQRELVKRTGLNDLKARYGDYFVLRENPQLAVLCELGFLTHYQEEVILNSKDFQEQAAEAIFQGLLKYFKEKNEDDS